jgi:hypothetical protein
MLALVAAVKQPVQAVEMLLRVARSRYISLFQPHVCDSIC